MSDCSHSRPRQPVGPHYPEVMFVDPGVGDAAFLLNATRPEVESITLDSQRPTARQMAEALECRRGVSTIHIVAHGAPGRVAFAGGD